jgi:glucosamine kinase
MSSNRITPLMTVQSAPSEQIRFMIGVDGGGTRTRALLADRCGAVLAEGSAGPSALGQGIDQAWRHVSEAMTDAAFRAGVCPLLSHQCALGAGLSGASVAAQCNAFAAAQPGCALLALDSDGFVGVLGAHNGGCGALVVSGTGSVGEALRRDGRRARVGGWGWVNGDEGSGAWLGKQAVRHAQRALDGRDAQGMLAAAVWGVTGRSEEDMLAWSATANQQRYASLAPIVFEHEGGDPVAARLIAQAACELERIAAALDPQADLPLAFAGSVAVRLSSHMSSATRARSVRPKGDAAAGALLLVRQALTKVQHQ